MPKSIAKELSWLSFNERVLQEAADPNVPLIERVRFLGIFSNNLDEFFRVRVADVRRLVAFSRNKEQEKYKELLGEIGKQVQRIQKKFERVYEEVVEDLGKHNIYLINEKQLIEHQAEFVSRFFHSKILPELTPVLMEDGVEAPPLDDESIYLACKLVNKDNTSYAILRVPTDRLPRFIEIPARKGKRQKVVIVLENIIRHCLVDVFRGTVKADKASAYTIKVTRDAELALGDGITQSLMDKISSSLKMRSKADAVRFVYDQAMPKDLSSFLVKRYGIGRYDSLIPGGRYHNSKDFMSFPNLGAKKLEYKSLPSVASPAFENNKNVFKAIQDRDVLLYYPYHSFRYVEDLLYTAAIDPAVESIHISLYRMAKNSHIANALMNAVRNNKTVTAVVELQARFDEQANLRWAEELTEAGVKVIFGVPGLKVHSKLILITRKENSALRYYSHIGTGNFNEKTARIYTDFSLFTYNQSIGKEVAQVFDFIAYNYRRHDFKHLAVSPFSNREVLLAAIDQEIHNAQHKKKSGILFKCNNLVDTEVIKKLYEASAAGVKIRLIIRGMCCLVPGVPGLSENIEAISIIDRFLEHTRLYVFNNNNSPKYYISSADLMTRNLDYRVEVTAPIYDKSIQAMLQGILDIQWRDNVKARLLDEDQTNEFRGHGKRGKTRSQIRLHKYLNDFNRKHG